MEISRRDLLKNSALIGLAFLSGESTSALFAREPQIQSPAKPIHRLALTSWAFRAYMDAPNNSYRDPRKPGMNMIEFAKMALRRFEIRNINPLTAHFRSAEPRHLEAVRRDMTKAGSCFVDLGLGHGNFWDPDPAKRKAAIEYGSRWIDNAIILGSPSVRQHLGAPHGVKPNIDLAAQTLGKLADYGAKKNIVVNLENDSLVNEDPFFIARVIEKTGNPYLRAIPDFGNTLLKRNPHYNYQGLEAMFKHVFNMAHVKDEVVSSKGKVYKVNLAKAFGIAKANGYRGYFSMEFDTPGTNPFEGTRRLVKETLHYIS